MSVWRRADPSARLTDVDEARTPRETTFADAQQVVNFVVFEPTWLPEDCSFDEITLRPEQPPGRPQGVSAEDIGQTPWSDGNPCAVRAVLTGDGRRLRIKQFLYDWAPAAASVAPLWRTSKPHPVECGYAVGWLGTDYKDNRGACVQVARTQFEVSVLDGTFRDDELADLIDGLSVAAPERALPVRTTPFHALSYWMRFGCEPPSVPHGLWDHSPVRPFDDGSLTSPFASSAMPAPPLTPAPDRFLLDSAAVFPDAEAVECVFRHRENRSDHLWLNATATDSDLAPSIPPEPSDQPAEIRETVHLRGAEVFYAALTEEFGAWEAFWAEEDVRYAVWASASEYIDGDGFRRIIETLSPP